MVMDDILPLGQGYKGTFLYTGLGKQETLTDDNST